jgi:cell division septation protein DedD
MTFIIRFMDRSLQARLIGAIVLVIVAVFLIPELLSGRKTTVSATEDERQKRGELRSYTIELGGTPSSSAPRATSAPVATQPIPAVVAQTGVDASPAPARDAAGEPPRPSGAPEPAPAETPAVPPPTAMKRADATQPATAAGEPARGTWSVQVGAFGSGDAARKLVRDLESGGFHAYVSPIERSGKTLHRVRVGPEAARTAADGLASQLKARGLPATVVAN